MAKEKQVGFTLRIDAEKWSLFTAIAALKRTSAVDMLRAYVEECIEKNRALINIDEIRAAVAQTKKGD